MPLHYRDYKPTDQIFTHVLPNGTNINIDSSRLHAWCKVMKPEIFLTPVDPKMARSFVDNNIASQARCIELLAKPQLAPIILCKDGTFTDGRPDIFFVDGHHRYVLAYMLKLPFIPAHVLDLDQWQPFLIEGVPPITQEHLLAMPITPRNY